jgi:hypothetical protein
MNGAWCHIYGDSLIIIEENRIVKEMTKGEKSVDNSICCGI